MRRFATVDVGTNTTLLLVVEVSDDGQLTVIEERAEITRLGRGIGAEGRLGPTGVAATLAVLREYAAAAQRHDAKVIAVGTEALRRAPNAADFLEPATSALGAPVQVIDGDREAALTFLAAVRSFPDHAAGDVAVVDIGGGSTEIIFARAGAISFRRSLPLGSVRLTERHIRHDPALPEELAALRAEVDGALAQVPFTPEATDGGLTLIGIAGTVTTLAAMSLGLRSYDPELVHGHRLTAAALEVQTQRLMGSTQPERETMAGLDPRRADVILAGACLLTRLVARAGVPAVLVSDRGIRWGLVHEAAGYGGLLPHGASPGSFAR